MPVLMYCFKTLVTRLLRIQSLAFLQAETASNVPGCRSRFESVAVCFGTLGVRKTAVPEAQIDWNRSVQGPRSRTGRVKNSWVAGERIAVPFVLPGGN